MKTMMMIWWIAAKGVKIQVDGHDLEDVERFVFFGVT